MLFWEPFSCPVSNFERPNIWQKCIFLLFMASCQIFYIWQIDQWGKGHILSQYKFSANSPLKYALKRCRKLEIIINKSNYFKLRKFPNTIKNVKSEFFNFWPLMEVFFDWNDRIDFVVFFICLGTSRHKFRVPTRPQRGLGEV